MWNLLLRYSKSVDGIKSESNSTTLSTKSRHSEQLVGSKPRITTVTPDPPLRSRCTAAFSSSCVFTPNRQTTSRPVASK